MNYQTSCHNSSFYVVTENAKKKKKEGVLRWRVPSLILCCLMDIGRQAKQFVEMFFAVFWKLQHPLHPLRGKWKKTKYTMHPNSFLCFPCGFMPPFLQNTRTHTQTYTRTHTRMCVHMNSEPTSSSISYQVISRMNYFMWWQNPKAIVHNAQCLLQLFKKKQRGQKARMLRVWKKESSNAW